MLAVAGFARVYITEGSLMDSVAISASLFCIVMSSVLTGTALPFGLAMMGIDPANAGTSVQVLPLALLLMSADVFHNGGQQPVTRDTQFTCCFRRCFACMESFQHNAGH